MSHSQHGIDRSTRDAPRQAAAGTENSSPAATVGYRHRAVPIVATLILLLIGALCVPAMTSATASAQVTGSPIQHAASASAAAGPFIMVARHSNKCLTAAGSGNGSAVLQLPCDGSNPLQQWTVDCFGCVGPIKNVGAGNRCLDLWGNTNADAVAIILWDCYGAPWQDWRMNPRGETFFELRGRSTDRCVDVPYASTISGISVYQWGCHWGANNNQQWSVLNA